ncbi:MAG TPA: DUF4375 domain-containing protein [Chitinophagaceae bacterium]|nr:DUF4375 domain-containing protein [Chitinophagaceae bacterium]
MRSKFLPKISLSELVKLQEENQTEAIFEQLVLPLHEELYKKQDFSFIETLSPGQELLLRYDYVRMQALQGGFIQLIQNGYINLLLAMPDMLKQVGAPDMAQLLDDVLRVYTLNEEELSKETSVEDFAKLYQEFIEFEDLDTRFAALHPSAEKAIVAYALRFPDEFIEL